MNIIKRNSNNNKKILLLLNLLTYLLYFKPHLFYLYFNTNPFFNSI